MINVYDKGIVIIGLLCSTLFTGCVSHKGAQKNPVEKWHDFNQLNINDKVTKDKADIVFVRDSSIQGQAVNIFISGEYLTSLLPHAYKQAKVCPNNQKLVAIETQVNDRYLTKEYGGQLYNLPKNKITYLRVSQDHLGKLYFSPMTIEEFNQVKSQLKEQVHTLARVDENRVCNEVEQQSITKKFTIDSSALFKFDKSDENNMLTKGQQEIKKVTEEIHNQNIHVNRIDVIGYTDPDGSDVYNQKLSAERAQSVKSLMVNYGLTESIIHTEGRGRTNLLINDCLIKYPQDRNARLACNQPNRRVEIIMHGYQK